MAKSRDQFHLFTHIASFSGRLLLLHRGSVAAAQLAGEGRGEFKRKAKGQGGMAICSPPEARVESLSLALLSGSLAETICASRHRISIRHVGLFRARLLLLFLGCEGALILLPHF